MEGLEIHIHKVENGFVVKRYGCGKRNTTRIAFDQQGVLRIIDDLLLPETPAAEMPLLDVEAPLLDADPCGERD